MSIIFFFLSMLYFAQFCPDCFYDQFISDACYVNFSVLLLNFFIVGEALDFYFFFIDLFECGWRMSGVGDNPGFINDDGKSNHRWVHFYLFLTLNLVFNLTDAIIDVFKNLLILFINHNLALDLKIIIITLVFLK